MFLCSGLAIGAIALRGIISTDGTTEPQVDIPKNRIRKNVTLIREPFTSNHESIGLNKTVFSEELPVPKPLFRGVCGSSITHFHPDGSLWLARLKPHIDRLIAERVDAISPS